jgi:50S ribosomal subunit-associated GTPase HflX
VTALNKVDLLALHDGDAVSGLEELYEQTQSLSYSRPDAQLISAQNGWGLDDLRERIAAVLGGEVAGAEPSRWVVREQRTAASRQSPRSVE